MATLGGELAHSRCVKAEFKTGEGRKENSRWWWWVHFYINIMEKPELPAWRQTIQTVSCREYTDVCKPNSFERMLSSYTKQGSEVFHFNKATQADWIKPPKLVNVSYQKWGISSPDGNSFNLLKTYASSKHSGGDRHGEVEYGFWSFSFLCYMILWLVL